MSSHLTGPERETLTQALVDGIAHTICATKHGGTGWCSNCRSIAEQVYAPMITQNSILPAVANLLAAQRAALADLITRHEAHDGRVPASQLRAVLGMPARDRGER